jgi:23S rRNA (uridine2552-2'-O)-methyltransferase
MTRWYQEKKREHFYKEAKKKGYRARSAFKLKQIQKKFKIIHKRDIVIDLGAAPGGWSQVSKEIVGEEGTVIGVDRSYIQPISGITFLKGDLTKDSTLYDIKQLIGVKKVDVVLSDMSPNISGNYSVDHARSIHLCEKSFDIAEKILQKDGNFVCKIFMGEELEKFYNIIKDRFRMVKHFSPSATRKSSSEIYLIALTYNKKNF